MSELLTIQELAGMWRCSVRHARDVLVKTPGFPDPAPGSGPKLRVWNREEVRAFRLGRFAQISHSTSESRASA